MPEMPCRCLVGSCVRLHLQGQELPIFLSSLLVCSFTSACMLWLSQLSLAVDPLRAGYGHRGLT